MFSVLRSFFEWWGHGYTSMQYVNNIPTFLGVCHRCKWNCFFQPKLRIFYLCSQTNERYRSDKILSFPKYRSFPFFYYILFKNTDNLFVISKTRFIAHSSWIYHWAFCVMEVWNFSLMIRTIQFAIQTIESHLNIYPKTSFREVKSDIKRKRDNIAYR